MNRSGFITTLLVLAVLVGVGSAAFLVMRSPAFWYDVGAQFVAKALPQIVYVLTVRNTPEIEKQITVCARRGGRWDNFNKLCVENR